jgi:hypothetical protein
MNRISELFVGIGLGVAPFIPGRSTITLDIVPCDFVANLILSTISVVILHFLILFSCVCLT